MFLKYDENYNDFVGSYVIGQWHKENNLLPLDTEMNNLYDDLNKSFDDPDDDFYEGDEEIYG